MPTKAIKRMTVPEFSCCFFRLRRRTDCRVPVAVLREALGCCDVLSIIHLAKPFLCRREYERACDVLSGLLFHQY